MATEVRSKAAQGGTREFASEVTDGLRIIFHDSQEGRPVVRDSSKKAASPRGGHEVVPSSAGRILEPALSSGSSSPPTVVSATDAARRFSDLVSRACYQRETFVIERGGRPVCQLGPLDPSQCTGQDLLALVASLPHPDIEFLDAVEKTALAQAALEKSPWES